MLPEASRERVFYSLGMVPARYTHPEWAEWVGFPVDNYWPFLTSMFLHGGWAHIIGNMWSLWIFGDNVEDRMGPVRFALFYLICGLIAGCVHWFTNTNSVVPAVGASGAIAGVLGAYFVMFPRARIIVLVPIFFYPLFIEIAAVVYLLFWALTQLYSGAMALTGPSHVAGVAWWAHVGGFAAGVLLHPFFARPRRAARPLQRDEYVIEGAWV
jgi:membrane associated rhomboid family serine protease